MIALVAPDSGYTPLQILYPHPFSRVAPVSVSGRVQMKEKELQAHGGGNLGTGTLASSPVCC